jgi:hypothetical protein
MTDAADATLTRLREVVTDPSATETDAEVVTRQFAIVDFIVAGASLRQTATHFKLSVAECRREYQAGVEILRDRSIDSALTLRDEITARQRSLIFANMSKARAGDRPAATIIHNADALLASIWGLRTLRVEMAPRPKDPGIAAAMEGYLAGIEAATPR